MRRDRALGLAASAGGALGAASPSRRSEERSSPVTPGGSRSRASRSPAPGSGGARFASTRSSGASSSAARAGRRGSRRRHRAGRARRRSRCACRPRCVRFGTTRIRERVLLELPPERAPPQGAVLELRARPVAPRGPETGFDERAWLARQGVHVVLRGGAAAHRRPAGRDRWRRRPAARARRATLARGTTGERRRLLAGIVLGEDEGLDPRSARRFRASGLFHLLAVSGQNVAFLAVGVVAGSRARRLRPARGRGGSRSSCVARVRPRGRLAAVGRPGRRRRRARVARLARRPSARSLALPRRSGALVLLAWMPTVAARAGLPALVRGRRGDLRRASRAVGACSRAIPCRAGSCGRARRRLRCGLVTAPIVLVHFGARRRCGRCRRTSLAEPAMPPFSGSGSLAAAASTPCCPARGGARAGSPAGAPRGSRSCARVVAGLAVGAGRRRPWSPGRGRARGGVAASSVGCRACRAPRPLVAVSSRSASSLVDGLRGALTADADVGRPDAACVSPSSTSGRGTPSSSRCPAARSSSTGAAGGETSRASCARLGLRSLAAIVLTHPQRDHIGGAADVLRRLSTSASSLDPALERPARDRRRGALAAAARTRRPGRRRARAGERYRLGRLRLRVLWPDDAGPPSEDPNQHAIVAPRELRRRPTCSSPPTPSRTSRRRLPLRAVEVLKVAHHGSEDPGLARRCCAAPAAGRRDLRRRGNDYGHPRPETLAALGAAPGSRSYRTDEDGRVVVESDGRAITVRVER